MDHYRQVPLYKQKWKSGYGLPDIKAPINCNSQFPQYTIYRGELYGGILSGAFGLWSCQIPTLPVLEV